MPSDAYFCDPTPKSDPMTEDEYWDAVAAERDADNETQPPSRPDFMDVNSDENMEAMSLKGMI